MSSRETLPLCPYSRGRLVGQRIRREYLSFSADKKKKNDGATTEKTVVVTLFPSLARSVNKIDRPKWVRSAEPD